MGTEQVFRPFLRGAANGSSPPALNGSIVVWVEFNQPDGSLYQEAAQPLKLVLTNGAWLVLDLPPAL
jgi:hypothetical protein